MPLDVSIVQLLFVLTVPWDHSRVRYLTSGVAAGHSQLTRMPGVVHQASSAMDPTSVIEAFCQNGPPFLESRNEAVFAQTPTR